MRRDVRRQAIELYDRFTHEGMDRRDFMSRMAFRPSAASMMSISSATVLGRPPPILTNL